MHHCPNAFQWDHQKRSITLYLGAMLSANSHCVQSSRMFSIDSFRQTSSVGGYRPSRSLWRPCRRASVLRRSMSSGAVRSSTDGRRASGEEFFRSKILEAQLPRGVSSRLTDRRFASSCSTKVRQRDEIMHFSFFQASMSPLSAHCRCFR